LRVVEHRRHDRLWRLVFERAGQRSFSGWVGVVCEVAVEQLTVDAAAIAVRSTGRSQELVGFTDAWAQHIEELQYTVGDGPAVEAFDTGGPVLVSDLAGAGHRWPGFAEATDLAGAGAVFAFPLQGGAIRLGTMALYRRRPGSLSRDEVAEAAVLADLATTALLADTSDAATELAPWAREGARGHYEDVNVATGMLAAELRISIEDAFLRLRAHAFSNGQPLLDVARAVLGRELHADAFRD
jgi:GAF domain/ANTAR domain